MGEMSGNLKLTLLATMVCAIFAGCTTSQNVGTSTLPTWTGNNAAARAGLSLDVSNDSYVDGGSAGGYNLSVKDYGQDIVVSVQVENAQNLKALYFNLDYDPQQVRPLTAEPTDAMGAPENVLSLTSLKERGTVTYGQVLGNYEWRTGLTGDATVAQVEFRKEATPVLPRSTSAVPHSASDASQLTYDPSNATAELRFDYANRGDYDQNGQVNISDLTPLGKHLNEGTGTPFPRASNLSMIDGSGDGVVSISDLTPLGAGLNDTVTGYNVYCTTDGSKVPTDNTTPSDPAARVGNVVIADHQGTSTADRIFWTFDLASTPAGAFYWVRPYEAVQTAEGTPSNVTGDIPAPNLTLASPPANGDGSSDATPYEVNAGEGYDLILTDPTDGDVSTSGQTAYNISDSHVILSGGNHITIGAGTGSSFTVSGSYKGVTSNVLHFTLSAVSTGLNIEPDDTSVDPWAGAIAASAPEPPALGTIDNPYILHDSTFNPDPGNDFTYDLEFKLVAKDDANADINVDTLTWGSFPPFVALDINDATKGTFHANQFSDGYVFAQDASLNPSNKLYVAVQLDQN